MRDLEVETLPGVILGHKHIPVGSIGCYVPGGRYPMIASAHMEIITAKVAGVQRMIACVPPTQGEPHPEIDRGDGHLAGADEIDVLGGVQAVAAMALGTSLSTRPHDRGAGNAYVAEAKRQLYGRVGIDCWPGPTEIAHHRRRNGVDPDICATDLLGQAEHGPTSLAILITTSERLARGDRWRKSSGCSTILPTADAAGAAWRRHGPDHRLRQPDEEAVAEADRIASEHVADRRGTRATSSTVMTNYGALILGPRRMSCTETR